MHDEADERFFVGVGSSRDDRHVIIAIGSKTTSEFRLLDAADPLGTPRVVAERRQGLEYDIESWATSSSSRTTRGRVNFELAAAPVTARSADEWAPLDLTTDDEFVTGAEGFDDFIAISLRREGGTGVRVVLRDPQAPHGLGEAHDISVGEPIGTIHVGNNPEAASPTLQVVHESLVTPRTVEDYDVRSRTFTLLKAQRVRDDHDLAQYRQRREWATAPDGTRVPISIVHRADVVADGTAPGLLHGYGAYGIPSDPWFSVLRLSLLAARLGLRHRARAGRLRDGPVVVRRRQAEAKPHTFTDFVACADHLRGHRHRRPRPPRRRGWLGGRAAHRGSGQRSP